MAYISKVKKEVVIEEVDEQSKEDVILQESEPIAPAMVEELRRLKILNSMHDHNYIPYESNVVPVYKDGEPYLIIDNRYVHYDQGKLIIQSRKIKFEQAKLSRMADEVNSNKLAKK